MSVAGVSRTLIAAVGVAITVRATIAQTPATAPSVAPYRARLLGVFNQQTGDAIENAEVVDVMSRTSALTTKTGTVSLVFLPDGGSLVRIQKVGFQPTTIMVAISPADTVPFTILLNPLPQTLPTVVTKDSVPRHLSPGLNAFEERRKLGFGHFLAEAELRKEDSRPMVNVLRQFPGINFDCPKTGVRRGECWAIAGRASSKLAILGGQCEVDVYVDGAISTDNDLMKLPVNQFAGVEYYAGGATIPVQFNKTGSACGVLLFWTRER